MKTTIEILENNTLWIESVKSQTIVLNDNTDKNHLISITDGTIIMVVKNYSSNSYCFMLLHSGKSLIKSSQKKAILSDSDNDIIISTVDDYVCLGAAK